MSIPDLVSVLWRQRELLERLAYRLECEQLLVAAGRTRYLGLATAEVEMLLDELGVVELQRAAVAQQVTRELGLAPDASLQEIAGTVDPPWTAVLMDHRSTLIRLTSELGVMAEASRGLMAAGLRAVEAALEEIGLGQGVTSVGYDAQGRTDVIAGGSRGVVDRSL